MTREVTASLDEGLLTDLLAELGARAGAYRFEVAPNPCVGAAILSDGAVVARGYHRAWGGPHAEVEAIAAAEASGVPREKWDLLLVTLEPCSSTGKTPPCVEAILAAGIGCVVVGELDPDARHRGRGLEQLREAGVEVYLLDGHAPLEEVAPHFLAWNDPERLRIPRPWTIAKWAQTRTGQLLPPEDIGEGRWISCDLSREEVAVLRGRVDAIVTGVGTVLDDDPRLTVRPPGDTSAPPLRVVLDSYLRTPPDAELFAPPRGDEGVGEVHLLAIVGADASRWRALAEAGARVHGLRGEGGDHVSLAAVQEWLWSRGLRRVLLETGPTLLLKSLERGYVDQVRIYTGDVNGGRGVSSGAWLATGHLEQRLDRECGTDAVLEAFVG